MLLVDSPCCSMVLETPLLYITAKDCTIDRESVERILRATEELMEGDVGTVRSVWDLRACRFPSFAIQRRCIAWALRNKRRLDEFNRGTAVILHPGPLSTIAAGVFRVYRPACPTHVVRTLAEALAAVDAPRAFRSASARHRDDAGEDDAGGADDASARHA